MSTLWGSLISERSENNNLMKKEKNLLMDKFKGNTSLNLKI